MQPDRPAAPDGTAPDGSPLTDRQRQAFASLGDRLAQLPDSHPSALRYQQARQKLLNDSPVADVPLPGGTAQGAGAGAARGDRAGGPGVGAGAGRVADRGPAAGIVPGTGARLAGEGTGLGGRHARSFASREAARDTRSAAPGRSGSGRSGSGRADAGRFAGRDATGRAGAGGRGLGDPGGWPLTSGGAGRRDAYRPWFYGSGEPWFSADWTGDGAGWPGATPGRSR